MATNRSDKGTFHATCTRRRDLEGRDRELRAGGPRASHRQWTCRTGTTPHPRLLGPPLAPALPRFSHARRTPSPSATRGSSGSQGSDQLRDRQRRGHGPHPKSTRRCDVTCVSRFVISTCPGRHTHITGHEQDKNKRHSKTSVMAGAMGQKFRPSPPTSQRAIRRHKKSSQRLITEHTPGCLRADETRRALSGAGCQTCCGKPACTCCENGCGGVACDCWFIPPKPCQATRYETAGNSTTHARAGVSEYARRKLQAGVIGHGLALRGHQTHSRTVQLAAKDCSRNDTRRRAATACGVTSVRTIGGEGNQLRSVPFGRHLRRLDHTC